MAEKQRTFIDAGLLEELRARAHEQSRTEDELLEEIAGLKRQSGGDIWVAGSASSRKATG